MSIKKELSLEKYFTYKFKHLGGFVQKNPSRFSKSIPDRLYLHSKLKPIFIEFKREGTKLVDVKQFKKMCMLKDIQGFYIFYIFTKEQADQLLNLIRLEIDKTL